MRRSGVHFAGARDDVVYRAIVADSLGESPRIATVVVEVDGEVVGAIFAIVSDSRSYWRRLALRHPAAAAAILRHRARRLGRRVSYRRRNREAYESDEVLVPSVDLPAEVAERLSARPPASGSPRPGEHGPGIALGLFMGIDPKMRGRGLAVPLFERLFEVLRDAGAERYDCSFSSQDPAAIRMHCNYPFTIYRMPGGYWASLRLADLGS